jgi:hypothetical protein
MLKENDLKNLIKDFRIRKNEVKFIEPCLSQFTSVEYSDKKLTFTLRAAKGRARITITPSTAPSKIIACSDDFRHWHTFCYRGHMGDIRHFPSGCWGSYPTYFHREWKKRNFLNLIALHVGYWSNSSSHSKDNLKANKFFGEYCKASMHKKVKGLRILVHNI